MPINFYNIDSSFNLKNKKRYKKWIENTIATHNYNLDTISIIFCSTTEILRINKKFLKHNFPTDVITFPYTQGNSISADIFICIPVIKENAKQFNQKFLTELNRVIIHGVLHLIGFNDKISNEQLLMREEEDKWISKFDDI